MLAGKKQKRCHATQLLGLSPLNCIRIGTKALLHTLESILRIYIVIAPLTSKNSYAKCNQSLFGAYFTVTAIHSFK